MKEIYTLIIGAGISAFLIFLYLHYKIRKFSITKKVLNGNKDVKRMYYILKKNHFTVLKIGKSVKFYLFFDNKRIENEFKIDAVVKKNKKYLCFISDTNEVTRDMILYSMVTGIMDGILINIMDFSFKIYKIKR